MLFTKKTLGSSLVTSHLTSSLEDGFPLLIIARNGALTKTLERRSRHPGHIHIHAEHSGHLHVAHHTRLLARQEVWLLTTEITWPLLRPTHLYPPPEASSLYNSALGERIVYRVKP